MKGTLLFTLVIISTFSMAQLAPKKANTILVKGVSFLQACNVLLDQGYRIAKKDVDLQTVETEPREYDKSYNAAFVLHIRVKDSVAIITGNYFAPWWDPFTKNAVTTDRLWDNAPIWNQTNRKGDTNEKGMQGYAFSQMSKFAKALGNDISYEIR
jgi:hypothetical protein